MDQSKVKEFCEKHIENLCNLLWLGNWKITLGYTDEKMNGGESSSLWCSFKLNYYTAHININPFECDSDEETLSHLIHELLHIVLSRYEVYRLTIEENYQSADNMLGLFNNCNEQTITILQNIFCGIYKEKYLKEDKEENENEKTD